MKYFIVLLGILFPVQLSAQQSLCKLLKVEEVDEKISQTLGPFMGLAKGSTVQILLLPDIVLIEKLDPGMVPSFYIGPDHVRLGFGWKDFAIQDRYADSNGTHYVIIGKERGVGFGFRNYEGVPHRLTISTDGSRGSISLVFSHEEEQVCAGYVTDTVIASTPYSSWFVPQELVGDDTIAMGQHIRTLSNSRELVVDTPGVARLAGFFRAPSENTLFPGDAVYHFTNDSLLYSMFFYFLAAGNREQDVHQADSIAQIAFRICRRLYGDNYRIYHYDMAHIRDKVQISGVAIVWHLPGKGMVELSYVPKHYIDNAYIQEYRPVRTALTFTVSEIVNPLHRISTSHTRRSLGLE